MVDWRKEPLCAATTAWSGISLSCWDWSAWPLFFNRCAVKNRHFLFATKELARRYIARGHQEKKAGRRDTRVATLAWVLHRWLHAAEDELRAGANFVDKEWELEHVSLSHLLIGLVGLVFCCGCFFWGCFLLVTCLVCFTLLDLSITRLLDLPTISSLKYNDCHNRYDARSNGPKKMFFCLGWFVCVFCFFCLFLVLLFVAWFPPVEKRTQCCTVSTLIAIPCKVQIPAPFLQWLQVLGWKPLIICSRSIGANYSLLPCGICQENHISSCISSIEVLTTDSCVFCRLFAHRDAWCVWRCEVLPLPKAMCEQTVFEFQLNFKKTSAMNSANHRCVCFCTLTPLEISIFDLAFRIDDCVLIGFCP